MTSAGSVPRCLGPGPGVIRGSGWCESLTKQVVVCRHWIGWFVFGCLVYCLEMANPGRGSPSRVSKAPGVEHQNTEKEDMADLSRYFM